MHARIQRVKLLLAGLVGLAAAGAYAGPAVYGESAMVKVRPSTAAHADNGVGLTAAKNEFASFQVVVNGADTGASNVSASLSSLAGPNGYNIQGNDLSLYREALLNISTASFPDSATGPWPDALVPDVDEINHEKRNAFPFQVPANEARAIWADIHVPADAPAGVYTGQVTVSGDNGLSHQVPVTLTVLSYTVPSTPELSSAFLLFQGNVCLSHTGSSDCNGDQSKINALSGEYAKMALEHRFSISNVFDYPSNGDFSGFDAAYGPFLDGTVATRLAGAKVTAYQFMGPRDASAYSAFASHMKAKGWYDRAFDYTGDEPPYGISFSDLQSRISTLHQGAPDLPVLVTTTINTAAANGLTSAVDIMVPVVNYLNGTSSPYQGDQRAGYDGFLGSPNKKLWVYQSCMSQGCAYGTTLPENTPAGGWPTYLVDVSAARNRSMEWVSYLENVSGELYYETANMLPSAWDNQYAFNGNGDGNLFYPGTPARIGGTTDVPVASIRMKMIRMGMQDHAWLTQVAQGDAAFAQKVASALAPAPSQVTDDGSAFDRARLQLEARYLELSGQPAAAQVQGAPPASSAQDPAGAVLKGSDPVTTPGPSGSAAQALGAKRGSGAVHGGCSAAGLNGIAAPMAALTLLLGLFRRRRVRAYARVPGSRPAPRGRTG